MADRRCIREQVTGTFDREQPAAEVLRVLGAALGAEVRREDDAYVLAGQSR